MTSEKDKELAYADIMDDPRYRKTFVAIAETAWGHDTGVLGIPVDIFDAFLNTGSLDAITASIAMVDRINMDPNKARQLLPIEVYDAWSLLQESEGRFISYLAAANNVDALRYGMAAICYKMLDQNSVETIKAVSEQRLRADLADGIGLEIAKANNALMQSGVCRSLPNRLVDRYLVLCDAVIAIGLSTGVETHLSYATAALRHHIDESRRVNENPSRNIIPQPANRNRYRL